MHQRFTNRVALVTGAGAGIGRAIALAFAREGAKVVVAEIDQTLGENVAAEIANTGGEAMFTACDVARAAEVEVMVGRAVERFGRIDAAVNNAGIEGARASTAECDEAMWRRVIDVNLTGVWLCMKYEIGVMLRQGSGTIVNIASIYGASGVANESAYSAAKHGVVGLTKSAALEVAARGIRINAVSPGYIETAMVMDRGPKARTNPDVMGRLLSRQPTGRFGRPDEVAEAVLWLSSDAASFVSGHPMFVDGAWGAR